MPRISATLSGIERTLLARLADANSATAQSVARAAAGVRILRPRDDPSGYFAVATQQARLNAVNVAASNTAVAAAIGSGAQSTVDQIRVQLNTIRAKVVEDEDGSLTADERAANQTAIDDAVAEVRRLVGTPVEGRKLFDGSSDYRVGGRNNDQVRAVEVYSRGATTSLEGHVINDATRAALTYNGSAGNIGSGDATFTVGGKRGSASFSVTDGQSLESVAAAVSAESHNTGVTASVAGSALNFVSVDYGSNADVRIAATTGTFAPTGGDGNGTGYGTDAELTINNRSVIADGNRATYIEGGTHVSIELTAGFTGALDDIALADGGKLTFALSPDLASTVSLALPSLAPELLGGPSGTLADLTTGGAVGGLAANTSQAIRIVDEALGDLDRVSGRVDGFNDAAVASSSSLLAAWKTDLEDSIQEINGVNDAEEVQLQAHHLALADNALAGLAILQQQRSGIIEILRQAAGLS
ncbi:MAG: flagellin hook IN motif-containing protein [Pirellulales bacterium]